MKVEKKNSFLRIGLILLAMLCAMLCLGTVGLTGKAAQAAESNVSTNVYIGDIFEAKEYKMSSADNVVAEGMRIVYPSGGIYSSDKFVIEQAGKYQVTYYATVNGERIEETKSYTAIRRPQDMIIADVGMKVEYGMFYVESPYELTKEQYGAKVRCKAGQTISFATNLKVADLTKENNFLEMIVEPSVYGETDFEKLTVRLTDSADKNNYVEYLIQSSNIVDGAGMVSYVKAGASGRQYGGWENTSNGKVFHTTFYGSMVFHSYRGWGRLGESFNNKTISEHPLTLALDHASKQVFCGPASNQDTINSLVNDLDDPGQYKSNAWGGFKGDEVIVTIKPEAFAKTEGVLLIKSFGGYNLAGDVVDNTAPEISFHYDMTEKLPVAEVGTRFPIIPFEAKDALDKTVKTNVWVNHIDANGRKITVENDGESFFVEYAGKYEVIYRAEDYSGNRSEERVEIIAQESAPNIYVGIGEPLVEMDVYETVHIPYAADMNIYGGSGALKVERAVYSPSKKLLEIKDALQLTELGDYKVVYQATDYYGRVGYGVVTIRSQEIAAPKFVTTPNFTDVLLKDFIYEFPKAFAVETVDGKLISLPYKTYVNGNLVEGSFTADGEKMEICYVADGATGSAKWENTIPVVNAEKGKYKSKYFHTVDEIEIIDQKTSLEFVFSNDAQVSFVNSISSQNVAAMFFYEVEKANFTEMILTLTDGMDKNLSVIFRLNYDQAADQWFIQLNGDKVRTTYAARKGILSFTYSAKNHTVIDTIGEEIIVITSYSNGEKFQGFSDFVYLDIAFAGVKDVASMHLTQICNQAMGYNKSSLEKATDEAKPIIVLDEAFLLRQKLGAMANVPTAKAFDVLGQITEFTVTVEMDGKVLVSGDATEKVEFVLDKAGYYNVTYFAKDTNGNKMTLPYMIMVSDETAPTLTVENSLKSSYQVGEGVKIPTYSATDNGENCYIHVMVILPDNEMRLLHYVENGEVTSLLSRDHNLYDSSFKADDNTFIAEKKGLYILRVVAYDEYYNYTVKEIEFWVK